MDQLLATQDCVSIHLRIYSPRIDGPETPETVLRTKQSAFLTFFKVMELASFHGFVIPEDSQILNLSDASLYEKQDRMLHEANTKKPLSTEDFLRVDRECNSNLYDQLYLSRWFFRVGKGLSGEQEFTKWWQQNKGTTDMHMLAVFRNFVATCHVSSNDTLI